MKYKRVLIKHIKKYQPLSALVFCTPNVREPLLVFAAYFDKKNKENKIRTNKLCFISFFIQG